MRGAGTGTVRQYRAAHTPDSSRQKILHVAANKKNKQRREKKGEGYLIDLTKLSAVVLNGEIMFLLSEETRLIF